jgi:hypothetical protein
MTKLRRLRDEADCIGFRNALPAPDEAWLRPRFVAGGKRVGPLPPRRSRRALLTHRAPPSGSGVEAVTG